MVDLEPLHIILTSVEDCQLEDVGIYPCVLVFTLDYAGVSQALPAVLPPHLLELLLPDYAEYPGQAPLADLLSPSFHHAAESLYVDVRKLRDGRRGYKLHLDRLPGIMITGVVEVVQNVPYTRFTRESPEEGKELLELRVGPRPHEVLEEGFEVLGEGVSSPRL